MGARGVGEHWVCGRESVLGYERMYRTYAET